MGKFNKGASTNLLYIISDWCFCILSCFIAWCCSIRNVGGHVQNYILVCIAFMIIYNIASRESRLYNVTTFFYADRIFRYITKSFFISAGVTSTLLFYVSHSNVNRSFYIIFLVCSYIGFLISAVITRKFLQEFVEYSPRTIMVGGIEHYGTFERFLHQSNQTINILGYVSIKEEDYGKEEYLGHVDEIEKLIHTYSVDQVYIMNRKSVDGKKVQRILDICTEMGVTTRVIADNYRAKNAQCYVSSVGTFPVITYHTVSLNSSSKAIKRIVDIIGSLVGIILSSPLMLATAIAIKLESDGPVLFKQERVGMNGRHFKIYKFRSMCQDAEAKKAELMEQNEMGDDMMFKMKDDPRVTKVGKFIRKTSLDELPQFFNVLKGDMSLVGTRPPTVDEVNQYKRTHWRRISIKPGITGMWQVSGRSTITDFDEIVELDTQYIDQWSLILDIQIMFKTVWQVVARKGAC